MSHLSQEIQIGFDIPEDEVDINDCIVAVSEVTKKLPERIFFQLLESYQVDILDRYLGARWHRSQECEAPWVCKACGSASGFRRRGKRSRDRKIKTSIGTLAFPLYQVTCDCGKTFSPFLELLAIEGSRRVSEEFKRKIVETAVEIPYGKTANLINSLTFGQISCYQAHRIVQEKGKKIKISPQQAQVHVLLQDSTKVKAGEKERGENLNLAIGVNSLVQKGKRVFAQKELVAFGVAPNWQGQKEALGHVSPRLVITDGEPELVNQSKELYPDAKYQRGLWHLQRTTGYYLWKDGLAKKRREPFTQRLKAILDDKKKTKRQSEKQLRSLVKSLQVFGCQRTATFLNNAWPDVFTYKEEPVAIPLLNFYDGSQRTRVYTTTSVLEREMREINRRADVGARWSIPGITNNLGLKVARKYKHREWYKLWPAHIFNTKIRFEVLNVNAF